LEAGWKKLEAGSSKLEGFTAEKLVARSSKLEGFAAEKQGEGPGVRAI
jgi:hypothetical protein